jgi:hypothetical protein
MKPNIDWKKLSKEIKSFKTKLRNLASVRKKLTSRYPILLNDAKEINRERKIALREKKEKKEKIEKLAKKYNQIKAKWLEKFPEDTLYMNVKAQKLAKLFKEALKDREEVIIHIPSKLEKLYSERYFEAKSLLSQIRAINSQYKIIQREIDKLQTICFVLDWQKIDATHYFDEFCEIEIYQLSVKKKKMYHRQNEFLCKIKETWYFIVDGDAGDPVPDSLAKTVEKELIDKQNETNLYRAGNQSTTI